MSRSGPASVAPLETLVEINRGALLPLPPKLARVYGSLRMPGSVARPHVFSNFVTTLDGVVSLQVPGHASGGDISGFDAQDRMVMGLLRAVADVVVVGSGTLAADRRHVWTAEEICPGFAVPYRQLGEALGHREAPLNVIVSGSGRIDLRLPVFTSGKVRAIIITTSAGAKRLASQRAPDVAIRTVSAAANAISARALLHAIREVSAARRILVEGGPRLLADFYAERLLAEQFLTLAPQIAGREAADGRLSLAMGQLFAPRDARWGTLVDVRRGGRLLFLRYAFAPPGHR